MEGLFKLYYINIVNRLYIQLAIKLNQISKIQIIVEIEILQKLNAFFLLKLENILIVFGHFLIVKAKNINLIITILLKGLILFQFIVSLIKIN